MKITLRQLQIFVAIARTGSVTAAAQQVAISQPAASQALRELESLLDKTLFTRNGKRLQITEQGRSLLPQARAVLEQIDHIESQLSPEELTGTLHISASVTIGNYLMPAMIAEFRQRHPQLHFELSISNTPGVIRDLVNGKAEIGFIEGFCQHPDLEAELWQQDELVVFSAAHSAIADTLDLDDLLKAEWVMRETGSGTRILLEQALGARVQDVKVSLSLTHIEAVKQAVIQNLGLGCLSQMSLQQELRMGLIKHHQTPLQLTRTLLIIKPRNNALTDSATQFLAFARELR